MIPDEVVQTINHLRATLLDALVALRDVPSFATLCQAAPAVQAAVDDIARVPRLPRLQQPCDGRVSCAFIGWRGHGKSDLLATLFPELAARRWFGADTTAQGLRVSYAPPTAPDRDEVTLHSWDANQIKEMFNHPAVKARYQQDGIRVAFLEDGVEVDGGASAESSPWRFPPRCELRPFPQPHRLSAEQGRDARFIRALIGKEPNTPTASLIMRDAVAYQALQLRGVVKGVGAHDEFSRLTGWDGAGGERVKRLVVLDLPALTTDAGDAEDEVLRHCLSRKSHYLAQQLWHQGEVDLVVHVVTAGQPADFTGLWQSVEEACGRLEDLGSRALLAVNQAAACLSATDGEENADLRAWVDFSLNADGRIKPARICWLDRADPTVDAAPDWLDRLRDWAEPDGDGHALVGERGWLDAWRDNMRALADPADRGVGFMLRQILDMAQTKGPALVLDRYLIRTGLLAAVRDLRELLAFYYDGQGCLHQATLQEALRACLAFLETDDLYSVERFAAAVLDPAIPGLVTPANGRKADENWAAAGFRQMAALLKQRIIERSQVSAVIAEEFIRHFDAQVVVWGERWGYRSARLLPPGKGISNSADLLAHCLKLHGREILHQLLARGQVESQSTASTQTEEDQGRMCELQRVLEQARAAAQALCQRHGVDA